MARYIDADALIVELQKKPIHDGHFVDTQDVSDAIFDVPTIPTASLDVVIDKIKPETPLAGVCLNLSPDDCKNAADFIEWEFFNHLKNLLDVDDLDNIDYLRSLIRVLDEMERAGKEDRIGK